MRTTRRSASSLISHGDVDAYSVIGEEGSAARDAQQLKYSTAATRPLRLSPISVRVAFTIVFAADLQLRHYWAADKWPDFRKCVRSFVCRTPSAVLTLHGLTRVLRPSPRSTVHVTVRLVRIFIYAPIISQDSRSPSRHSAFCMPGCSWTWKWKKMTAIYGRWKFCVSRQNENVIYFLIFQLCVRRHLSKQELFKMTTARDTEFY